MEEREYTRLRTLALSGQPITDSEVSAAGASFEDVWRIKSDVETAQTRDFYPEEAKRATQVADRTWRFVWSTEAPDHGGDIIRASGWDLSVYKRNPVALWSHDGRTRPPVGKGINVVKGDTGGGGKGLIGDIQLAPEGASEFTDALARFVEADIVRATSVGFRALETKEVRDDKERDKLGLGRFGVYFARQMLLEISLVSIPQHPDALGKVAEEILGAGGCTRQGVQEVIKSGWQITERDRARMLGDLCKRIHALGAVGKPDPEPEPDELSKAFDEASKAIERAKGVVSDPEPVEEKLPTLDGYDVVGVYAIPHGSTENQIRHYVVGPDGALKDAGAPSEAPREPSEELLERLENALDTVQGISKKQNEVITALSDLIERMAERRTDSHEEPESPDVMGILDEIDNLGRVAESVRTGAI